MFDQRQTYIHTHTHTLVWPDSQAIRDVFLQQSSPKKKQFEGIKKFWKLLRHIKCWQTTDEEVAQPTGCKESGLTMPVPWMEKLTPLNKKFFWLNFAPNRIGNNLLLQNLSLNDKHVCQTGKSAPNIVLLTQLLNAIQGKIPYQQKLLETD